MPDISVNLWGFFLICFTVFCITVIWMSQVARHFKTHTVSGNPISFSIFDLEFALSEDHIIKIIDRADGHVRNQLRLHLLIDFLFMAATYTGIAVLCLVTAQKMEYFGRYLFVALAAAQALPWIFDVIENVYLLQKTDNPVKGSQNFFKAFQWMVKAKFIIALTGVVCSLSGLLFFWLVGKFHTGSLLYVGVIIIEILLFYIISTALAKSKRLKTSAA